MRLSTTSGTFMQRTDDLRSQCPQSPSVQLLSSKQARLARAPTPQAAPLYAWRDSPPKALRRPSTYVEGSTWRLAALSQGNYEKRRGPRIGSLPVENEEAKHRTSGTRLNASDKKQPCEECPTSENSSVISLTC
jgi:hypothetical protein